MIIVRNSFIAKPGHAGKLAAQLKDVAASAGFPGYRVLTDVTGDFNRVVLEYEVASISDFEVRLKQYMTDEAIREKMKGYTDHWLTGHREIMQTV